MKTATWITAAVVSVCLTVPALGQRTLPRLEILEIFEQVTSRPRETWIPAGTIEAVHTQYKAPQTTDEVRIGQAIQSDISSYVADPDKRELTSEMQKMRLDAIPFNTRYRLANESRMKTSVTAKYDGERSYWAINVMSRQDSVRPEASLAANYLTDEFNTNWNRRRMFVWDGQEYTTYTSANQATVDAAGLFPHTIPVPLTAGLIAWGHGPYSLENLRAADVSATEIEGIRGEQIQIEVISPGGLVTTLTLDPERGYAVMAATMEYGDKILSYRCSGYEKVGTDWVPTSISVERRDAATNRLLRSDEWSFSSVTAEVPAPSEFRVAYAVDAKVSYLSTASDKASTYLYSHTVDTDRLLADRLAYAAAEGAVPQNCATAAIQYVASELNESISTDALKSLVGAQGETTLLAMKRFLLGQGLYCRAVRTDVETLKALYPARAILYLGAQKHFVALESADDRDIRIVDLSKNKFYYKKNCSFFPMDWAGGAALLVSTSPITGAFDDLDDAALAAIAGGAEGYSCTEIIQDEDWHFCTPTSYGCAGVYTYWWYVCDCEPGSGSCSLGIYERRRDADCLWNPTRRCHIEAWYIHYIYACDGGPYQDCVY
jgi:hypothetical protein